MKNVDLVRPLGTMFSGFPATQVNDPKEVIRAYMTAVEDIPAGDVYAAIENFRHGRVERKDYRFAPSTGELIEEAKRIWHKRLDETRRKKQLEEQARMIEFDEMTPEQLARRKAFVAEQMAKLNIR